jgi:hypothetical protein
MRIRTLVAVVGLFVAAIAFPASAGASTVEDCQAQIAALRADTAAVTNFASVKDQTGLLGKLDNASTALAAGKNAGAVAKLTDFRTKVQTLGATGKLGADDAARLDVQAAAAVSCIDSMAIAE